MGSGSNRAKGIGFLVSGIAGLLIGFLLSMALEPDLDDWRYYFDSEYRAGVEFWSVMCIILEVWSAVEIVIGIILLAVGDAPKPPATITCVHCGYHVPRSSLRCPSCNQNPTVPHNPNPTGYYTTSYTAAPPPPPVHRPTVPTKAPVVPPTPKDDPSIWKPAALQRNSGRFCAHCGKPVEMNHSFCAHCGQRTQ